jgi:hypothetical protein
LNNPEVLVDDLIKFADFNADGKVRKRIELKKYCFVN